MKPLFIFIIASIAFLPICMMLIYYGSYLQKTQTTAKIQQIIYNSLETKTSVFSNYLSGLLSSPQTLRIDIDFKGIQLLNYAREVALSNGVITDEVQDVSVKAKLSIGPKIYDVRISPTGLNLDMIGDIKKRAYKVRVLNGKKIYGMREFKLLPPHSRHNIVEWIGHALEKKEGLIALRYFFVEAILNGEDLGIYAFEEHFNKELLENNKSREGIIFKIYDDRIKIFNENKIRKNDKFSNQIRFLKTMIQGVINNEIEIDRAFDLNEFASQYAIIDLMNGYHALGFNATYYLNSITNLIEPITREYNSLRYSEGPINTPLLIEQKQYKSNKNIPNSHIITKKLFQNNDFVTQYLKQLYKLSDVNYLNNFFKEINEDLNSQKNIIYREDPFYKFPKEYLYDRQGQISEKLNSNLKIISNIDIFDGDFIRFKFKNNSVYPIKLIDIFSKEKNKKFQLNNLILPGNQIFLSFDSYKGINRNNFNFSYKIAGIQNNKREKIIIPKSFTNDVSLPNLWNKSSEDTFNQNNITINHSKKIISFKQKIINIKNDLFIPKNYKVVGDPGLVINLSNGASIFSRSAFNFVGSKDNPITVTSFEKNGGGIVITSPEEESVFVNTIFEYLTSPNIMISGLTGSISIYDTKVFFKNCVFNKNKSEDFLNLINSKYRINDSSFINVFSDALDSDFSNGFITKTKFTNIGNDALDFSGSVTKLSEITIDKVRDKALSVGEISNISGKNIYIANAEIGITSKDLSDVTINKVKIVDTKLGFAVFKKKEEYGAAKAKISNLEINNIELLHLIDQESVLSLNGENMVEKKPNVEIFLYGANYGISSK